MSPRTKLEAGEVVGTNDGYDRNAGGHDLEARGPEPVALKVVALDVSRRDVPRDRVRGTPPVTNRLPRTPNSSARTRNRSS